MVHLSSEQRYTIEMLLKKGFSEIEIGNAIGKHRSVIYRELARNKDGRSGEYNPSLAERKYHKRNRKNPKRNVFPIP